MITIVSKDTLRNSVEKASGGKQTVLYTRSGQPSYMNIVTQFACEDMASNLGRGIHPAFIVNGQPKSEFFYGTYLGTIRHGELVSLPDTQPADFRSLQAFDNAVRCCGNGWHISTQAEWAAIMLWSLHAGLAPQGNTDYGQSHCPPQKKGRRVDGHDAGYTQGNPVTVTGSGPLDWRHDNTPYGIADLCGNMWEWQNGVRLVDGEIQLVADNNAADHPVNTPYHWQAIRLSDGMLVPCGSPGTAKLDSSNAITTGNAGAPILGTTVTHYNGIPGDNTNTPGLMDAAFEAISCQTHVPPDLLRQLGLFPHQFNGDKDQIYMRNYGERFVLTGGSWYSGQSSGMRSICFSHTRDHSSATVGCRPAFIL